MNKVNKICIGMCLALGLFSGFCFGKMVGYKAELKAMAEKEVYYQKIIENDEKILAIEKQIAEKKIEIASQLPIMYAKIAEIRGNTVVIDFGGEFHEYEYIGGNPTE